MKDYSKFMKDKDSFVTGYTCKGDKILVSFSSLGKKNPIIYDLDQDSYDTFEDRLKEQYEIVIGAKKKIVQDGSAKAIIALVCGAILGVGLGIGSNVVYPDMVALSGAFVASGAISFTSALIVKSSASKKENDFDLCAEYLEVSNDLENAYVSDNNRNIVKHVSRQTASIIAEQEELSETLRESKVEAPIFSVDTMDRIADLGKLKDMRDMLLVVKAMDGLKKPVELDSAYSDESNIDADDTELDSEEEYSSEPHFISKKRKK